MSRETQPYKKSFSTSIGSGLGSVFSASGKQYYILEHKISSRFHKVGESQEIIIDNIELGRSPKCQVRFDESFATVSRRHAAIVKDGDKWKLVQLSSTNPTLLNGKQVAKEWYLQNGDEIQLSVGGPKLGFLVPTGKNSTVGSIGFTRRLSLFRQQALRPYKTAITLLCIFLVLAIGGLSTWMVLKDKEYMKLLNKQISISAEQKRIIDSLKNNPPFEPLPRSSSPSPGVVQTPAVEIEDLIDNCKDDVFFLYVSRVYLTDGVIEREVTDEWGDTYGWSGSGFLLDDGRFVTARHCVQGWRFEMDENVMFLAALANTYEEVEIVAEITAISRSGKQFKFKSTDFVFNDEYDGTSYDIDEDGEIFIYKSAIYATDERLWSTDWSYVPATKTKSKGSISFDAQLSKNLRAGTVLHVLGFPCYIGVLDTPHGINPPYNTFNVAMDGLDNSGCILHTRGVDHGNSGGPIFAKKDNKLVVVGIASHLSNKSSEYSYSVPVSAIR